MGDWFLEPGHTAAEFSVRHMMVTDVRGAFKNVTGDVRFEEGKPEEASVRIEIDAAQLWSGEPERDAHLKSADFLDVDNHPRITFEGRTTTVRSAHEFVVTGDLNLRGVTRRVELEVRYLGRWRTPWWEGDEDRGPRIRAGFVATACIDRRDFGVSWNAPMDAGGIVVGNAVNITIDAEAVLGDRPG